MQDIFTYIKSNESSYNTVPIPVVENYEWHMARHVKLTALYLNSQYETGNKEMKPFYNIILPAMLTAHRSVSFHLKEINFFIDNSDAYYKSMLLRKYHERWARINDLTSFLDEMTETYSDYGGVLVKKTEDAVPIVIPWQQIAFVDQTDIMTGPICEKHQYNPEDLKAMESKGWGDPKNGATATIQEIIDLSSNTKTTTQVKGRKIGTPSKYTEVYELHGVLPKGYLNDDQITSETQDYVRQMHIIAFYKDTKGNREGLTLFKGREKKSPYKFYSRDKIYGRALGRGGVEELFDAQVWTNYTTIQQKDMLDNASKILYQTADKSYNTRNRTDNVENGQILTFDENKPLSRIDNTPHSLQLFTEAVQTWNSKAQEIASTFNPFAGIGGQKVSYRMGALLQQQASALHQYRKGKIGGQFLPELYKDWILPQLVKDLTKDTEFSTLLSGDEMEQLCNAVVNSAKNRHMAEMMFAGKLVDPEEIEQLVQNFKQQFYQHGNQKFLKIMADEFKDVPIDMIVDFSQEEMAGAGIAEELTTIFAQLLPVLGQDPQFFQKNPQMAKIFNDILENSGLNPMSINPGAATATPVQNTAVPAKQLVTAGAGAGDEPEQ